MGLAYAPVELSNPCNRGIATIRATSLADSGTEMLCLPLRVAVELELETTDHRSATLPDGRQVTVPYVGPIQIRFGDRHCYVGALVMGDEVVLGSEPMESLDLVVSPHTQEVTVNPASPDRPA